MQAIKLVAEQKLRFSISAASRAFEPPLPERALRAAIRNRELSQCVIGGRRKYLLRDDLLHWCASKKIGVRHNAD